MKRTLDIIIPCYNEEGNIKNFYEEIEKIAESEKNYEFNYIFVNDGSSDKTVEKIKELQNDKKVKLLAFSRNFGKEAAILAGLDYSSNDASIIVDADLEMPLKYIKDMLRKYEEGYKLVLTVRANRKKGLKNFLASFYYVFFRKMSGTNINQDALDFQLMDREVVQVIKSYREENRFFKGITASIGYDTVVLDVEIATRVEGVSKFSSFKRLFSYGIKGVVSYSSIPLLLGIYIGFIISLISIIYMFYIILQKIVIGIPVPGYASTMCIILFLFGVVLVLLGIIGYYISLIYNEVKRRPNYIIAEKINFEDENK